MLKLVERLLKSKKEVEEVNPDEEIEKSFDEALEAVEGSLEKANPDEEKKEDESKDEADEPKEDEEEEKIEKSDDDEIFVDAEPIIKALVSGVRKDLKRIESKVAEVEKIQKAQAELSIASGKLLKSLKVEGDEPKPRKGVIATQERFTKAEGEERTMDKAEALNKLQDLAKAGKVDSTQVAMIESRINKGAPLPDIMFAAEKKEKEE